MYGKDNIHIEVVLFVIPHINSLLLRVFQITMSSIYLYPLSDCAFITSKSSYSSGNDNRICSRRVEQIDESSFLTLSIPKTHLCINRLPSQLPRLRLCWSHHYRPPKRAVSPTLFF